MDTGTHQITKEVRERRARGHSGRVAILDLLTGGGRELSAAEIQSELPTGLALARIHYHLRVLTVNGFVVRVGDRYRLSQCE